MTTEEERITARTERIRLAVNAAEAAFWSVIGKNFPEATSGDLDPTTVFELSEALTEAVEMRLAANVHEKEKKAGARFVDFTSPGPAGKITIWKIARSADTRKRKKGGHNENRNRKTQDDLAQAEGGDLYHDRFDLLDRNRPDSRFRAGGHLRTVHASRSEHAISRRIESQGREPHDIHR
ncbi:MAG: hypothetical protein GWM98_04595 [Nitrospinaceae bacterium]|nr:hypothetical protein [Deltaproteobacteria bacterium]NIY14198.1 hypothetical protein [Nitrospinaceae bacterium]